MPPPPERPGGRRDRGRADGRGGGACGPVPDVEGAGRRAGRRRLPRRRGPGDRTVPRRPAAAAAAARGRARRRQDRGGQGAGPGAGHPAVPAAVLRGHRRRRGAVRVELPPAAARHPAGRGARRRRWPRTTCSAPSTCCAARCCRRSSTPGRGRPCCCSTRSTAPTPSSRRSLFEVLAEAAVTVPELGTIRATAPAGRRPHLQPHPRPARRADPPLPLPLDRLPRRPSGSPRSSAAGCRAAPSRWPWMPPAAVDPAARRSTWSSRPASPRRSTGWPR